VYGGSPCPPAAAIADRRGARASSASLRLGGRGCLPGEHRCRAERSPAGTPSRRAPAIAAHGLPARRPPRPGLV